MCAGGQKWDHLVINVFALLFHLKIDEPGCEDFELLGRISLKDHCTLSMQRTQKIPVKILFGSCSSRWILFFTEKLSSCCVALLIINE